jgi:hypothetical protein
MQTASTHPSWAILFHRINEKKAHAQDHDIALPAPHTARPLHLYVTRAAGSGACVRTYVPSEQRLRGGRR